MKNGFVNEIELTQSHTHTKGEERSRQIQKSQDSNAPPLMSIHDKAGPRRPLNRSNYSVIKCDFLRLKIRGYMKFFFQNSDQLGPKRAVVNLLVSSQPSLSISQQIFF